MAQQGPQGPPKGTVDLFDVMATGAEKDGPAFDPYNYLYVLDRDSRKGAYSVSTDEAATFEKYKDHPIYKGNEEHLKEDIASISELNKQLTGNSAWRRGYRPPANLLESLGARQAPEAMHAEGTVDKYLYHSTNKQQPSQWDTPERMAAARGLFVDRYGAQNKLNDDDLGIGGRNMVVDYETDEEGRVTAVPYLRELKMGESPYGKALVSKLRLQDETNNALGSLLGSFASELVAGSATAVSDIQRIRLEGYRKAYETFDAPKTGLTWQQAINSNNLPGIYKMLMGPADVGYMEANEQMFPLVEQLKANEGELRKNAKQGDRKAQAAVDVLDLYDGADGASVLESIANSVSASTASYKWKASEKALQDGATGSWEGFMSTVGQGLAFIVPQAGAARGIASGLVKGGSRAFVTQAMERGGQAVLTRAGKRLTYGVSSMVPAGQMMSVGYQSALEAGYRPDEAAAFAAALAPVFMVTESMVSTPWMVKSYLGGGGNAALKNIITSELKKAPVESFKNWGSMAVVPRVAARVTDFLKKGSDNALANRVIGAMEAGAHEFPQEGLDELAYVMGEMAMDNITGHRQKGKGAFGTQWDGETFDRVMSAAIGGGIIGTVAGMAMGGRRKPEDQNSILEMAMEGRGQKVNALASRMVSDGILTEQDQQAIGAEVTLGEQAMKVFGGLSTEQSKAIRSTPGLMTRYADLVAQREAIVSAMQPAADTGGTPTAEMAESQRQLGEVNTAIDAIVSGQATVETLKAYGLSAVGSDPSRRSSPLADVAVYDQMATDLMNNVAQRQERIVEGRQTRQTVLPQLNAAIDNLIGGKSTDLSEALVQLEEARTKLKTGGALAKEDVRRILSGIDAKKTLLVGDLLDLETGDKLGTEKEKFSHRAAAYSRVTGEENEAYIERVMGPAAMGDELDAEAKDMYMAMRRLDDQRKAMGPEGIEDDDLIAQYEESSTLLHDDPRRAMSDRLLSVQMGADADGKPLLQDTADLIAELQNRMAPQPKDLEMITGAIDQLQLQLDALDAFTGPWQAIADRLTKDKATTPAFQALSKQNAEVYGPLSSIAPGLRQEMFSRVARLAAEKGRLHGLVDERSKALQVFRQQDMGIRSRLADWFMQYEREASLMKKYAPVYDLMKTALSNNDLGEAERHMHRLEHMVNGHWKGDAAKGKAFISWVLDRYEWKGKDYLKTYTQRAFNKHLRFSEYFNQNVFDPARPAINEHAKSFIGTYTTNWVSRLMREDPALSIANIERSVEASPSDMPKPNSEQTARLMEVSAFMARNDQEVTDTLLSGGYWSQGAREYWDRVKVPRAILMPGGPGSGKTTLVTHIVRLRSLQLGRAVNVMVVAPGIDNGRNIQAALQRGGVSAKVNVMTLQGFTRSDVKVDSDLLIVDEAHVIDPERASRLKVVMEAAPSSTTAVLLGDPNQSPSIAQSDAMLPVEPAMLSTTPLSVSFRHGNTEMITLLGELEAQVQTNRINKITYPVLPTMRYAKDRSAGVLMQPGTDISDIVGMFAQSVRSRPADDAMLIVLDANERDKVLNHLRGQDLGIPEERLARMVRTMDQDEHSALGLEAASVYVAYGADRLGASYTRFLFTSVSRAKHFVAFNLPQGNSEAVSEVGVIMENKGDISTLWKNEQDRIHTLVQEITPTVAAAPSATAGPAAFAPQPYEGKYPPGTVVGVKPAFFNTSFGQTLSHLKGKELKVIGATSTGEGDRITVQDAEGNIFEFKAGSLTLSTKVNVTPTVVPPTAAPVKDDVPPVKESLSPINAADPNLSEIVRTHSSADRKVTAMTAALLYDEGQKQFSIANKRFALRKSILSTIAGDPGAYSVSLVHRTAAPYFNNAGQRQTFPAIEVHLDPSSESLLGRLSEKVYGKAMDYVTMRREGHTMIGVLPLSFKQEAADSSLANEIQRIQQLSAGLKDGDMIPGYDGIPLNALRSGKRIMLKDGTQPFKAFSDHLDNKGFVLKRPRMVPNAWVDKKTGGSRPAISVQVLPFDSQFAPATEVFVRSTPVDATYLKQWKDALQELISDPLSSGENKNNADNTTVYKFFRFNQSLITENGVVKSAFEPFFDMRKGALYMKTTMNYPERLQALKSALAIVTEANGMGMYKLIRTTNVGQDQMVIHPHDIQHLVTDTQDVAMPEVVLDFSGRNGILAGPQVQVPGSVPRYSRQMPWDVARRRESIQAVEGYYRRVLGDRFIQGKLTFKPALTDVHGRALWGAMENGYIALEATEEGVRRGIARHEAVHFVLDRLIDPDDVHSILVEAKREAAKETGVRPDQVTDDAAHEHIAQKYESATYDTKTLLGRFIGWLKSVMKRFRLYRSLIDDLLWSIERGDFRDAHERDNRTTRHASAEENPSSIGARIDPSLREDLTAAPNEEPQPVRLPQVRLSEVFGGVAPAANVISSVALELIRVGQYAPPSPEDLRRPVTDIKQVWINLKNKYKVEASRLDPNLELADGTKVPLQGLSVDQINDLDDTNWNNMRIMQLSRDEVLREVWRQVFPNVDPDRIERAPDVEAEMDTDMDQLDHANAMVHNTNDELNAFDRISGLARLLLDHPRLIAPAGGEGPSREGGMDQWADRDLLRSILSKTGAEAFHAHDQLEAFANELLATYNAGPQTKEGIHAYSLYKRFLDPAGSYLSTDGKETWSYRRLLMERTALERDTLDQKGRKALDRRLDLAERVLSNVVRMGLEISSRNTVTTQVTTHTDIDPYDGSTEVSKVAVAQFRQYDGTSQLLADIEERTNTMYVVQPGAQTIDQEWRNQFAVGAKTDNGAKALYTISSIGVRAADGTDILRLEGKPGTDGRFVLQTPEHERIADLFRTIGYPVSINAISNLMDMSSAGEPRGPIAEVLGMWAMVTHAAIHRDESGTTEGIFSWDMLDQERRKHGGVMYGGLTDEEGNVGEEEARRPRIASLFRINRVLAAAESRSRGTDFSGRSITPTGNVRYTDTLGDRIRRVFPVNTKEGHFSSRLLEDPATNIVDREQWIDGMRNLMPLTDATRSERITDMYYGDGIKDIATGRGVEPSGMTDRDLAHAVIDVFADQALTNWKTERLYVPLHLFGDRNNWVVSRLDGPGGSERVISVNKDKDGKNSVRVNDALLARWVLEVADRIRLGHVRSLAKWRNYLTEVGAQIPDQAFQPGNSTSLREEVLKFQNEGPLTAVGKFRDLMLRADFIMTQDYVMEGEQIVPGKAAMMDHPWPYNADGFAKLDAARSNSVQLVAVMRELFENDTETEVSPLTNLKNLLQRSGYHYSGMQLQRSGGKEHMDELLRGMMYMHHIVDAWTSPILMGEAFRYKDHADWLKRSVGVMAPGHAHLQLPGGMGAMARIAFFGEPAAEHYPELAKNIAKQGGEVSENMGSAVFDGQGFRLPWSYKMARRSMGGPEGIMRQGANKPVIQTSDIYVKYMELVATAQVYALNPLVQEMTTRSLLLPDSPDQPLLKAWTDALAEDGFDIHGPSMLNRETNAKWRAAYDKASNMVLITAAQLGLTDQLIHMVSSHKNAKMGLRAVNRLGEETPFVSVPVDTRGWSFQTKLDRDPENLQAPYHTQAVTLFGLMPWNAGRAQVLRETEAAIANFQMNVIRTEMDAMPGETVEDRTTAWLKRNMATRLVERGSIGRLVELVHDPASSVNDPVLRDKLIEHWANRASKQVINPHMAGQLFTQASAFGMKFLDESGNLRELKAPSIAGGKYVPGEVLMPFTYAKMFGVDADMSLSEMRDHVQRTLGNASLKAFDATLTVYVGRTPMSATSGGQVMRVVGFVSDVGNVVFIPPNVNGLTGADYDGDQLTVLMPRLVRDRDGLPEVESDRRTLAGLQNLLYSTFISYYEDEQNLPFIFMPTGTARIEKIVKDLRAANPDRFDLTANYRKAYDMGSMLASRSMVHDGGKLVGIVANAIKGYAYLSQAYDVLNAKGVAGDVFTDWEPPLEDMGGASPIDNFSQLLNGSLDNLKLLVLADTNVNQDNIQVVLGTLMQGYSLENAIMSASAPDVVEATRVMQRKRSLMAEPEGDAPRNLREELFKNDSRAAQQALGAAQLQEAVDRVTRIFSMNVAGIPSSDHGHVSFLHNVQHTLDVPLGDLQSPSRAGTGYHEQLEPFHKNKKFHKVDEGAVRAQFDPYKAVMALENMQAFLQVFQHTERMYGNVFLNHTYGARQLYRGAMATVGRNGVLGREAHNAYNSALEEFNMGVWFDARHENTIVDLGEGDLKISEPTDRYRYLMEFPSFFKKVQGNLLSHPDSEVQQKASTNAFLEEVRLVGRSTPSLEMRDARRISDPVMQERIRRSITALDSMASGLDVMSGKPPLSHMITWYALIKNKFSFSRGSLSPFLPMIPDDGSMSFGHFMNAMVSNMTDAEALKNGLLVGPAATETTMLDLYWTGFLKDLPHYRPDLVRFAANAERAWAGTVYRVRNSPPFISGVRERNTPETSYARLNANNAVPFSPYKSAVGIDMRSMPEVDRDTYAKVLAGKADITIRPGRYTVIQPGEMLQLGMGMAVQVTAVNNKAGTVTVSAVNADASESALDQDPHNELRSMTIVRDTARRDYHGPRNLLLDDQVMEHAFERVSRESLNPAYRALAGFLQKHASQRDRLTRVQVRPLPSGQAGRYESHPDLITIASGLTGLQADAALLHEGLHGMTHAAFSTPQEQRSEEENAFVDGATKLYDQVKAKLGENYYGMSSVEEFIAEAHTNPVFQSVLKTSGEKVTWWQQLVNLVRRLLRKGLGGHVPLDNYTVSRVMDLTGNYIRYATMSGRVDNDAMDRSVLYSRSDDRDHGVGTERKPIVDIKDIANHLLSDEAAAWDYESMNDEQMVNHFWNRIDHEAPFVTLAGVNFAVKGQSQESIRQQLRDHVVPRVKEFDTKRKNNLAGLLNTNASLAEFGQTFGDRNGKPMIENRHFERFLRLVNHQPGTAYFQYDDLKNPERVVHLYDPETDSKVEVKLSDLGISHVPAFKGFNPMLAVRRTEHGVNVDLIDVTGVGLRAKGAPTNDRHLFGNYVRGAVNNAVRRIVSRNDQAGVRKLMLTLTAMAMKQANPKLSFQRMKVFTLNTDGLQHDSVWMADQLQEAAHLKTIKLLQDALPEPIKAVVNDQKLYDAEQYDQSWVAQYYDWLVSNPSDASDIARDQDNTRTQLERYLNGTLDDPKTMRAALRNRQIMMAREFEDRSELERNKEYVLIGQTLQEMDTQGFRGINSNRDTSLMGYYLKNAHNMSSDVVQWALSFIQMANSKVANAVFKLQKEHEPVLEKLTKAVWANDPARLTDRALDMGWKRFERLWVRSTKEGEGTVVRDVNGNRVEAHLNRLHWDKNDPHTASLLKSNKLTQAELDYSNWILDRIHDLLLRSLVHTYEQTMEHREADGSFNEAAARRAAERYLEKNWKRGWVPIVRKPSSEALAQGQFKNMLIALRRKATNIEDVFDDEYDDRNENESREVVNRYLGELTDIANVEGNDPIPGDTRLKRSGMAYKDGQLLLTDKALNENASLNLEHVLGYLALATERKIIHETESLPRVNAARTLLTAMQHTEGIDQTNNRKVLDNYAMRMVHGARPAGDKLEIKSLGLDVTPYARIMMTVATNAGLALNAVVGITSLLHNMTGSITTAMANDVAGNDLFGRKEWGQAVNTIKSPKENKLMRALMQFYFVTETGERDTVQNLRHSKTRNQLFSGQNMHIMNWAGDYQTRGVVMVAQMIKDGSWDAHSLDADGNVVYDEKKDTRFYDSTGKKRPDADLVMNWTRKALIDQGITEQTKTGALKAGYDLKQAGLFKWICDKYVIGGMDASQQVALNSFFLGQTILQFRRFMPDKIYNWYGRTIYADAGGRVKVNVDPFTGEKVAEWEKREIVSYMTALVKTFKAVKETRSLSWRQVSQEMTEAERFAAARMAGDLMMYAFLLGIYAGLKSLGGDDKKEESTFEKLIKADTRTQRIIRSGYMDMLVANPIALINLFGSERSLIPTASYAYGISQFLSGDLQQGKRLIPGRATFQLIQEATATEEE